MTLSLPLPALLLKLPISFVGDGASFCLEVFVLSGKVGKLYLLLIFARFVLKYNHSDTIKEETTKPVVSRHRFFSSLIMSACPIVPKGFFPYFQLIFQCSF